ncbi:MAG: DUF559 domain-containing protein, partial [Sphingomonas sp.]|nr:DUF559 domain-containing protein [Sphingomonas sp.]
MQDANLIHRATDLRNASTPFEALLWRRISRSQLGVKFRRQHVIGQCIVDFFCPAKGLIVEVDGDTHDAAKDGLRDQRHARRGFPTLRFTDADVGRNIDGVLARLADRLNELPDRWPATGALPHPRSP